MTTDEPKDSGKQRLTELRKGKWERLLLQQGSFLGEEAALKLEGTVARR